MRRIVHTIDQLPGWGFMALGIAVLGAIRVADSIAYLDRNVGGVELTRLLTYAAYLLLLIFAIRRRQTSAVEGALQVLVVLAGSSLIGLAAIWPLLPRAVPIALPTVLQIEAVDQLRTMVIGLPIATVVLWLSRRWGSHSTVTERRLRVVMRLLRERSERRRSPRVPAAPSPLPDETPEPHHGHGPVP